MKPNIVIVQPAHIESDAAIDAFCESLSDTHYVYLIRPGSAFRDDSPAGVRFLNHDLDRLPGFADVETVISVGDHNLAQSMMENYPAFAHLSWNPDSGNDFLDSFLTSAKVVQGDFGKKAEERLACAM